MYRSQPDLVAAAYDATSSTLAADYSYAQYPDQADATLNYGQYPYTGDYAADGTWTAAEQRKDTTPRSGEETGGAS